MTQTIVPALRFRDAKRMIAWLDEAFGFEPALVVPGEGDGIAHCELAFGGNLIMGGSEPAPDEPGRLHRPAGPAWLYVILDADPDVDAHCSRARAAGAEIAMEPSDPEYGGRHYTAVDPEGNVWTFGTYRPSSGG